MDRSIAPFIFRPFELDDDRGARDNGYLIPFEYLSWRDFSYADDHLLVFAHLDVS